MAMDFRIRSDFTFEMGVLFRKQILSVFQIVLIINHALASPVWMPQFLSGGHGRNIRHLPCVSRRTGEQGICMFAYTCMKSNGTHLGTCIDRFYFGSCCKLKESNNDLLLENHINFPLINNNQVSSPFYPDESKIQNSQTTSLQYLFNNKFTSSSPGSNYPFKSTTPKVEINTQLASTDKTIVDLAQHLATETYFLTPTTEKIYVPIYTSLKPNKTDSSSSDLYTTHGSSSSIFSDTIRPTTQNQSFYESTQTDPSTTQSYFLSTFQVVHNEGTNNKTSLVASPTKISTLRPITPEVVTTWTPVKPSATTPTTAVKKNTTVTATSKPLSTTTLKKPIKPVRPTTTTRKPPSKKPTPKPVSKPSSSTVKPTTPVKKPVQTTTVNKVTTAKPSVPVKKPTQPTKKPIISSPKPTTAKPTATFKPLASSNKPTLTSNKPSPASKPAATTKPTTTTTTSPNFSTIIQTTSEVVFTKPGITSVPFSTPPTKFGITTFRPDLSPTTKKPDLITGPYLTTFNYVSQGVKETTPRPMTKPSEGFSSTISNEISSSEIIFGNFPEAQEENTNIIFQQAGSTTYPGSSSSSPNDSTIPFFPEASKPGPTKPPWIQIVQSSSSESTVSTTAKTTSTTTRTSTYVPIFAGLNTSDYTQVCGRRLFPESRVVGGEKSTFGKWPWQISLRQWRTSTYLHKCGAALLNENWAITAAHCVENVPPSDLLLRLGEHDLSTEDEPYGFQERRVQIVASHPQFDPRTFEYDLALLRFYEPVKFQPNIIPVCVPEDSTNFVGQTAYVTGWGRLYEGIFISLHIAPEFLNIPQQVASPLPDLCEQKICEQLRSDGPLPSVLQEVSVPVINNTLCENMYRSAGYIEHIPEIFICAGWKKGGFDSCEGDSGGPMVIQRPDKRWLLAGVISWGIGCAEPNQPGVYTRISEFREWIHQILQF